MYWLFGRYEPTLIDTSYHYVGRYETVPTDPAVSFDVFMYRFRYRF